MCSKIINPFHIEIEQDNIPNGTIQDIVSPALLHQVGGNHYQQTKIQPIEVILGWDLDFSLGNVIKYIYRSKYGKDGVNPIQDLEKAQHYLEMYIAHKRKEEPPDDNEGHRNHP